MFIPLVSVALICLTQPQVSPESEAWIKSHAIPISTAVAGNGFSDLEPFRATVGDARIVSLGEPTHGTREAFQLKHRMLEFLASEMGFRIFSIEANMPEAYELNDYVLRGKGDPKRLIGGMYFWTWNTEEVLAMVEWMKRFNEERRVSEGESFVPLQFTGFDMQTHEVAAKIVIDGCAALGDDIVRQVTDAYAGVGELSPQGNGTGPGILVGTLPPEPLKKKKLTFASWIRTEDVGQFAGVWLRCDGPEGQVKAFNNMNAIGPKGTTPWKRYEFSFDVPEDVVNVNFGALIIGGGAAWFDDWEILLDGQPFSQPDYPFDFENPQATFVAVSTPGYTSTITDDNPHQGTRCLALTPAHSARKVDPAKSEAAILDVVKLLEEKETALTQAHGQEGAEWIIQNAAIVAQAARMHAAGDQGGSVRDESMAKNVEWILDRDPRSKIVLWAHNGHVSKSAAGGFRTMGWHLNERYPGEMVVVGFTTSEGQYTAVVPGKGLKSDNVLQEPAPGSVESHLHATGIPMFLIDIRKASKDDPGSSWAATARPMRGIGAIATKNQSFPCIPARMYDVLAHIETTTAARQLDTPPGR